MLYFIFFAVLGTALYLITPPIINEINGLANNFPSYIESLSSKFSLLKDYSLKYGLIDNTKSSFDVVTAYLQNTASGVFFTLFNIYNGSSTSSLVLLLSDLSR